VDLDSQDTQSQLYSSSPNLRQGEYYIVI